jgi:spore coat protein U-like protein
VKKNQSGVGMRKVSVRTIGTATLFTLLAGPLFAQTATTSFNVSLTITAECKIISASDLNFGSVGVISSNIDVNSAIVVQCTNNTGYFLGLSAGLGAGATVATRKMTGGTPSGTVDYSLYTTAARSTVWGDTGTARQAGTGTGANQTYTVYGRVAPQTTPAPGGYTDTITVTLTY